MNKLFAATLATALIAASAQADTRTVVVVNGTLTYDQARIATPHGAARLLRRIDSLAGQLCASSSPSVPRLDAQGRACQAQAVDRAVETLAAPMVTAAHADRRADLTVASR